MNADYFPAQPALYPAGSGHSISLIRPYRGFLSGYHTLVLAISLIVIFGNLPIYLYVLQPSLLPKYFFFFLLALIAPLLIFKSKALALYLMSPFMLWAVALTIVNVVHLWSLGLDSSVNNEFWINKQHETRSGLILTRIQYIVFAMFLGFIVFVRGNHSYKYVFALMAGSIPLLILLDFSSPGVLYPVDTEGAVLGRAAAMFINPTMAAEALLLIFLFCCGTVKMKYRMPFLILAGLAVTLTFTRSGMIAWVMLWIFLSIKRVLPRSALVITSAILGLGVLSLGIFENYLSSRPDLDGAVANLQARLNFFTSVKLTDESAIERAQAVVASWQLFLENPVAGAGAGATQFWQLRSAPHNQLLMLAAEYGILGILLWVWLAILVWKGKFFMERAVQLAMLFLFLFMSMFTHQMFDSASYWMVTFALVSVRRPGLFTQPLREAT